jgi:hypothetical protein
MSLHRHPDTSNKEALMATSHALPRRAPADPRAVREGEDSERAAARKWLAHRHNCAVISSRIIRKVQAAEEHWARNPETGVARYICIYS